VNLPLREPRPEDASALARLFTNPGVRMYLGGPREEAQAQASASELVSVSRELPAWVVVQPGSQTPSGFVSLDRHHDGPDVEVSFALMPEAQGSGLARAAVAAALLEAWHLGLKQVVAETQTANTRSVRLLEALGFTALHEVNRFGNAQTVFAISRPSSNAA